MSRDPKYDILFEPVRLGPKETPNRFYQAPYAIGVGCESPAAQAAFRAIRAEGGWGVVGTGYCSIHPESDDAPRLHVHLWDEDDVRALALLCDAVHEHGALASVELHYGPGSGYGTRLPVRETAIGKDEISELEALYAVAARRAQAAGFDVVNVHGAELSAITSQFLGAATNSRTDEYGGTLANRARFWLETLEQVRDAVGDSCAVTARLCLDTLDDGRPSSPGLRLEEEGLAFVALADHLVDFWDVQVGDGTLGGLAPDAGPSRYRPENWQRPWVERVRPATAKPIAGVGRFTNADRMVEAVRSGQLDLIGSARGSIADPFLPRKIEEGRLDDIRECIGCNMCASRVNQGVRIVCTQNATAGEEYRRGWHPEKLTTAAIAENDVLVVGAGPAGLECATILGKRGMRRVHIVDAAVELGGSLRWISRLPGLGEWGRVVNYRKIQIDKLKNVEFIPSTRLEPDDVLEYGAEIVVVATGSHWAGDGRNPITGGPIPGADAAAPHCLTPEQIVLEGKEIPGDRIVVYDCDGYFAGVGIAEHVARAGKQVTLVTPLAEAAPYLRYTGEAAYVARTLHELGVGVAAGHVVLRVEPGRVVGRLLAAQDGEVEWEADAVVLMTQRIPEDAIYRALGAAGTRLEDEGILAFHRIGDCVAPRMIADAVFDGHRAACEIDAEEPVPVLREAAQGVAS